MFGLSNKIILFSSKAHHQRLKLLEYSNFCLVYFFLFTMLVHWISWVHSDEFHQSNPSSWPMTMNSGIIFVWNLMNKVLCSYLVSIHEKKIKTKWKICSKFPKPVSPLHSTRNSVEIMILLMQVAHMQSTWDRHVRTKHWSRLLIRSIGSPHGTDNSNIGIATWFRQEIAKKAKEKHHILCDSMWNKRTQ